MGDFTAYRRPEPDGDYELLPFEPTYEIDSGCLIIGDPEREGHGDLIGMFNSMEPFYLEIFGVSDIMIPPKNGLDGHMTYESYEVISQNGYTTWMNGNAAIRRSRSWRSISIYSKT